MLKTFPNKARAVLAVSILICLSLLFSGCGVIRKSGVNGSGINIAKAQDLMENAKKDNVTNKDEYSKEFINSTADFSVSLFKKLASNENAIYSPTPLHIALALVLNGAEGKTRSEIEAVLTKHGLSPEEINIYYKTLIDDLTEKRGDTVLNIANSIWYDNGRFNPNMDFFSINKTYFYSDAYLMDFDDPKTVTAINDWVKEVTKGKIDKMVRKIDDNAIMFLFSSIYFNAKWENPFSKGSTYEDDFYISSDKTVKAKFMNKRDYIDYYAGDKEKAIILPYNDGRFVFLAILPNENVDLKGYIKELDYSSLSSIMKSMSKTDLILNMPKFEVEFGKSLNEELKALGIVEMFDRKKARLNGMGTGSGNIFVNDVAQKTYIRVDEEGTEAASVVKAEVSIESMAEFLNLNRPFIYAIVDTETDLPVFLGVLNNPAAKK